MQIDWSKAPEGYPIFIKVIDGLEKDGWHREFEDRYSDPAGRFWPKDCVAKGKISVYRNPELWDGIGIPPKGTTCLYNYGTKQFGDDWDFAVILLHDDGYAVFRSAGTHRVSRHFSDNRPELFRKIIRQEEIDADNRAAAIKEMHELTYAGDIWQVLGAIYDAGFRKQQKEDA